MAMDPKPLATSHIVYDGQCPFCSSYVRLLRLRDAVGPVELVDARSEHSAVELIAEQKLDLNEGMAFVMGDRIFYGNECVTQLALLSSPVGAFNRVNAAIFRRRWATRLFYPVLKAGRKAMLFLLRRKPLKSP